MLRSKLFTPLMTRTFKNFGHKREPIPLVTTVWHGFLTFTFIGLAIEWEKIAKFMFGDKNYDEELQQCFTKQEKKS